MGKNWLIRTKSNHILGPVSKEKVVELYQNGSIKPDDEVCSGNGYWFYVRESDLIDRFLTGNQIQTFNPISEAKDILTSSNKTAPSEPTRDDITLVGSLNLNKMKEAQAAEASAPASKPKVEVATQTAMKIPIEIADKKKIKSDAPAKQSVTEKRAQAAPAKQNYLKFFWIFAFVVLFMAIYFRKSILKSFFNDEVSFRNLSSIVLPEALAQENEGTEKKKSF